MLRQASFNHYDDSSDEEEIEDHQAKYDIAAAWKAKDQKSTMDNNELLSFVAHAAGIKLLYSKPVASRYYPLKNKLLSKEDAASQVISLIKTALHNATEFAISSLLSFVSFIEHQETINPKFNTQIKLFQADFLEAVDKSLASKSDQFIPWFKKNDSTRIQKFEAEMAQLLLKKLKEHVQFPHTKQDREKNKTDLLNFCAEEFIKISDELNLEDCLGAEGRDKAINKLDSYKSSYKNLLDEINNVIKTNPARGCVHNLIIKKLEDPIAKNRFLIAYVQDLLLLINKSQRLSSGKKAALKKYYSFDEISITDEASCYFTMSLADELQQALHSLCRPTISKHHVFISDHPFAFYANLRLLNRSQKRFIRNSEHAVFQNGTLPRLWRLTPEAPEAADVMETQAILNGSLGRRDCVEELGNYKKVHEAIQHIKQFFADKGEKVDDKKIARWLRTIFQGELPFQITSNVNQIAIFQKLQAITYLILGCEATRNPAMHVVNQMLLDLIIGNSDWSFEEAFAGDDGSRRMPMSPEGAVAIARSLESDYRESMPYPYVYPGAEEKRMDQFCKTGLISMEANLIRDWLKLTSFKPKKTAQLAQEMLNHIESHYKLWFPEAKAPTKTPIAKDAKVIEPIAYLEYYTITMQLAEKIEREELSPQDAYHQFIQHPALFKEDANGKYSLNINWPCGASDMKTIKIVSAGFEDGKKKSESYSLDFYDCDQHFLSLYVFQNRLTAEYHADIWKKEDINGLIDNFSQLFNTKKITCKNSSSEKISFPNLVLNSESAYSMSEFKKMAEQYNAYNITCRINHVILANASKKFNEFTFNLDWIDQQNKTVSLKVTLNIADRYNLACKNHSGYSWFVTEDRLLSHFYNQYTIKPGQSYITLQVHELGEKNKELENILGLWFTPDACYGELRDLHRGKQISGNEALAIYNMFSEFFKVKKTFICDESKLTNEDESIRIPLRLLLSLVGAGETWYQRKLTGVKLFECSQFKTAYNSTINQDANRLATAAKELRSLSLNTWHGMLNANQQEKLLLLYKTHLVDKDKKTTRSKSESNLAIEKNFTLQQLVEKIYTQSNQSKKITPDLISLVDLLREGIGIKTDDCALDSTAQDYWVKSRVRELLWGNYFWVRNRQEESSSHSPNFEMKLSN